MKGVQDPRDIKRTAVEGDQQTDLVQQLQKLVQILVFHKVVQSPVVPAADDGDRRVMFKTDRFDIEVRGLVEKVRQDPPFVLGCEAVREIPNLSGIQGSQTATTLLGQPAPASAS
ncbi:MAG: hypothetical protein QGG71_03240 [Pirellulaceae bacterium]|nr:hypothetical protein [Pirellulaceae bacterium]